jgi:hypothetical protein
MSNAYFVTRPENLSIQAPGIARLGFSLEEAGASTGENTKKHLPMVDLVMPVQALLQLHGLLTQGIADLEAKGLVKRNEGKALEASAAAQG